MSSSTAFHSWLAALFEQSEIEVRCLMDDGTALQFLIAWSLFEAKCFSGYVKAAKISAYAESVSPSICQQSISGAVAHFHERYQDKSAFKNLLHKQENSRLSELIGLKLAELTDEDRVFFLVFVVYRFRNNIFHGNKGVDSWLRYREQIQHCIGAMQVFVSHAEQAAPSIRAEAA